MCARCPSGASTSASVPKGNTQRASQAGLEVDRRTRTEPSGSVWSSGDSDDSRSVAWGDWDGDGDLDLAAVNIGQPNRVYENPGAGLAPRAV